MSIDLIDSPEAFRERHKPTQTSKPEEIHHYRFKGSKFQDYLFKDLLISETNQMNLMTLIHHWNFNEHGQDCTKFNGFSWGNVFNCGLLSSIPFLYREYLALIKLSSDSIVISKSEHENFKFLVKKIFSNVTEKEPSSSYGKRYIDMYIRRVLPSPPSKTLLKILSRFNFLKTKKKLTISDGATTRFYKEQKDFLFLNRKSLSDGFFHALSENNEGHLQYIPAWIHDPHFYFTLLENANARLGTGFDSAFLKIFSEYVVFHSSAQADKYHQWIRFYDTLFSQRKFTEFHVPGERYEPYLIGAQLAKKLCSAKTSLIWDGFSLTENPAYMRDNNQWLFDNYIVFDDASFNSLCRQGVEKSRLKHYKSSHPILATPKQPASADFDVMIFSWISLEYNPGCLPDRLPEILADFIQLLLDKKYRVAVKSKSAAMTKIYSEFLNEEQKLGITFVEGSAVEAIARTKVVVTGLSTSIREAEFLKTPTVIYEPIENGYADFVILEELKQKYKICRNGEESLAEIVRVMQ